MEVIKTIQDKIFLRKQKLELTKSLKNLEEQYALTKKYPEYGYSDDENAQEVEKFQENLGLQKNLNSLIKDTKSALKKIEKEKYGICENCKSPIEIGRLKAFPAAPLCVTCANKLFRKR